MEEYSKPVVYLEGECLSRRDDPEAATQATLVGVHFHRGSDEIDDVVLLRTRGWVRSTPGRATGAAEGRGEGGRRAVVLVGRAGRGVSP